MQTVTTKPSDWLRDCGGKAWAKAILGPEHINLADTSGYCITGPWVDFDRVAVLRHRQYLFVSSQYPFRRGPGQYEYRYDSVVVTNYHGQLCWINSMALLEAVSIGVREHLIPANAGRINYQYRAAVYAALGFDVTRPGNYKARQPATGAALDLQPRRRKIEFIRAGPVIPKQVPQLQAPAAKPPIVKSPLPEPLPVNTWSRPEPVVSIEAVEAQKRAEEEAFKVEQAAQATHPTNLWARAALSKMFESIRKQKESVVDEFPCDPLPYATDKRPVEPVDRLKEFED